MKKIVITSGKGGVGKTTVTANLGIAIADLGYRVLVIDIDFGLNNLDVVLGVENKVVYDIKDVLEGRCRIKQALVKCFEKRNLYVLPSDKINGNSNVSGQNLKLLVDSLCNVFDYVLLDCPAGIDIGFHRAVACADSALVVTTPNIPSLRDADKVVNILKSYKLDKVSLIVNRARGDLIIDEKMFLPQDIQLMLKTELAGVLPEEDAVFLYSGSKLPKKSDSAQAYKILADNVCNNKSKIFNVTNKYSGFFGSIRKCIKKGV
ncbi:MAG: septum site-determining protein MinD [Clostridia bacterium]|nr:septum site-determining protein MinD [Clostridia bacterium]